MAKQQSAGGGQPLSPEELGGLAYHLFNEGQAVVDTNPNEAIVWLAQCVRTLHQVPDNREFLMAALYFVGRALAQLGRNEESACALRATAYVGVPLEGESVADNFYATASLLAAIGARALAHRWFQESCRRYEALHLSDKAAKCQGEIERTAPHTTKHATQAGTHPVELSFLLEGRVLTRLTVTADGEMAWQETPADRPLPVGRMVPWQVRCTRL